MIVIDFLFLAFKKVDFHLLKSICERKLIFDKNWVKRMPRVMATNRDNVMAVRAMTHAVTLSVVTKNYYDKCHCYVVVKGNYFVATPHALASSNKISLLDCRCCRGAKLVILRVILRFLGFWNRFGNEAHVQFVKL